MESRKNRKSTKPKRKWKKRYIALTLFIVLLVGAGAYLYYLNHSFNQTVNKIYEPLDRGDTSKLRDKPVGDDDPISILLLGVDSKDSDQGRTDTIVVATINPNKNNMLMFNIPRDTRTTLIGRGVEDKINHAHAFGGINMTIDTVEHFLDIPIDYYAKVNMNGFVSIIDIFGGVTIDVDMPFSYGGKTFSEGEMHMDGETALVFSRMRKQDPRGDFGRNDRQKQVIQALIEQAVSVSSLTKIDDILDEVSLYSKTDIQMEDITKLRRNYINASRNSESFQLEGSGQTINGIYYYIVPEEERQRVSNLLKEHLELN